MEGLWVSFTSIAMAEIGDRTQLLTLVLAARYRRPWPIIAGILCATLANHTAAGLVGAWVGHELDPRLLGVAVSVSMFTMALWTLKPDRLDESGARVERSGAFTATLTGFFIAEMGDKTQLATVALAAAYRNLQAVIAGTTAAMLVANVPAVLLGKAFADRLPLRAIHRGAALLFALMGGIFLWRTLYR